VDGKRQGTAIQANLFSGGGNAKRSKGDSFEYVQRNTPRENHLNEPININSSPGNLAFFSGPLKIGSNCGSLLLFWHVQEFINCRSGIALGNIWECYFT
jgi:hypothetical protein